MTNHLDTEGIMSRDTKASGAKQVIIEALRWRKTHPKGNAWSYIDRCAGVLGITEADLTPQREEKVDGDDNR